MKIKSFKEEIARKTGKFWSKFSFVYKVDTNIIAIWHSLTLDLMYIKLPIKVSKTLGTNLKNVFLINSRTDDKKVLNSLLFNKPKPKFSLLRILITNLCNLNCKYCKVEHNICRGREYSIKKRKILSVLSFFKRISDKNSPKIIQITGGEPLLVFDLVKYVVEKSRQILQKNHWVVLFTNGTLLNKNKAIFLSKNKVKVVVSIDLSKKSHDTFRVDRNGKGTYLPAIKAYNLLKDVGCEVGISAVVGPHNVNSLPELVKKFVLRYKPSSLGLNILKQPSYSNRGYDWMKISPRKYAESVYEAFKRIRKNSNVFIEQLNRRLNPFIQKEFKYYDCGISGNNINIDALGEIGPCKSFLIMKRIYLKDFSNFFTNPEIFLQFMKRLTLTNKKCLKCPAIGICGGGCAYKALIEKGDMFDFSKEECEYMNTFLKLFIKDLFEIVKNVPSFRKEGWYVPSLADRAKLWPYREVRPFSLKYPIGHY